MSQDYRIEMQKEDAFMKKYKPMTLQVKVLYNVELEPLDYAEYQDGKDISDFDYTKGEIVTLQVVNEFPTE